MAGVIKSKEKSLHVLNEKDGLSFFRRRGAIATAREKNCPRGIKRAQLAGPKGLYPDLSSVIRLSQYQI